MLSFFMMLLLLPFLIPLLVMVWLFNGKGPIIFCQQRIGKNGEVFTMYKIRTLRYHPAKKEEIGHELEEVTPLGTYLRAYSIDEIPQLLNVFKGDMSFVGPRPLPVSYREIIDANFPERHSVRPGLICLGHLKGRNLLSWKARFLYDQYYIRHQRLSIDLYLLLYFPVAILGAKGNLVSPQLRDHPW